MSQVSIKKSLIKMESQLTLSAEDFPVRTSATQDLGLELRERAADYGKNTPDLLAKYDPDTFSWKTQQHCLIEGLESFSGTWPRSGMMRNGIAYQLPPLVRVTDVTEFGFWPTPMVADSVGGVQKNILTKRPSGARRQINLRDVLGGRPNPTWLEWLMGFPENWTELNN